MVSNNRQRTLSNSEPGDCCVPIKHLCCGCPVALVVAQMYLNISETGNLKPQGKRNLGPLAVASFWLQPRRPSSIAFVVLLLWTLSTLVYSLEASQMLICHSPDSNVVPPDCSVSWHNFVVGGRTTFCWTYSVVGSPYLDSQTLPACSFQILHLHHFILVGNPQNLCHPFWGNTFLQWLHEFLVWSESSSGVCLVTTTVSTALLAVHLVTTLSQCLENWSRNETQSKKKGSWWRHIRRRRAE